MKKMLSTVFTVVFCGYCCLNALAAGHIVTPKNANESYGYSDSPQQPWSQYRVHDPSRPIPKKVKVNPITEFPKAPADAIILFDGTNLDAWKPTEWKLVDGTVECVSGKLSTKKEFGAFQLHLEWKSPANFEGPWGNQGNNGVLVHDCYEIQIFDSNKINNYPDGACGAIYGQTPPLVNACLPAGNWQSYDIFFNPAIFKEGKLAQKPRITIMQNGIIIQNNQDIYGTTGHFNLPGAFSTKTTGPISFSGHGCPVQFRNIWIRPL